MEEARRELVHEIQMLKKELLKRELVNPQLNYTVTISATENSENFPRTEVCNGNDELDVALKLAYLQLKAMKRNEIQGEWRVVLTVTSYDADFEKSGESIDFKTEYEKEIGFGDIRHCSFNVFLTLDENVKDEILDMLTDRKNTLTENEAFVLNKIATHLGMDTWFMISDDKKAIIDLEDDGNRISLYQGIHDLVDGCYNVQEEGRFTLEEMDIFENILDRFHIPKSGLNLEREHECITYLKHHDKNFQKLHSMFPILGYKEADVAGFQVMMGDINNEEQQFTYYMSGDLGQGFGYKDESMFKKSLHAICYLPEKDFIYYGSDIENAIRGFENKLFDKDELVYHVNEAAQREGYTKDNFLQLTKNESEAKVLFDSVDGQRPSILWEEWQIETILQNSEELKKIYELFQEEFSVNNNIGHTTADKKFHIYMYQDEIDGEQVCCVEGNRVDSDGGCEPILDPQIVPLEDTVGVLESCQWCLEQFENEIQKEQIKNEVER